MKRSLMLAGGAVAGLAAVAVALTTAAGSRDPFRACRDVVVENADQIGGAFELVDEGGRTVTDADVLNMPSLVYFGYTFCPDVCPLDNARNAEAVDILAGAGKQVQPVFVSIDPERDTPDVVAEFTDVFHPDMIGLTGTPEQVKAASDAYRTFFEIRDAEDEYYLVDHSTFTYFVVPGHGFVDLVRREEPADEVAARLGCILEEMEEGQAPAA